MKLEHSIKLLTSSVVAIFLVACTNSITGLQKSADFSLEKLKQEGLMVAAVADGIAGEKDEAVNNYDAALSRQLADILKTEVKSSNCIADPIQKSIRDEIKTHPDITDTIFFQLKSATQCSARYAIISRLERDEISQRREVQQDYLFTHRESGVVRQNDDVIVDIQFIRERKLTAAYWIVDRQNAAIIWRGAVNDVDLNVSHHSRIFPSINMLSGLWADDYVNSLPATNNALYPPPQSREQAWDVLSQTFAKQLK